jgi:hypothetical protein
VRPVLEERAPVDEQPLQVLAPVARIAREQDVVVRALDGRDAVDLHEAEPAHHVEHAARARGSRSSISGCEAVRHDQGAAHLGIRQLDHRGSP